MAVSVVSDVFLVFLPKLLTSNTIRSVFHVSYFSFTVLINMIGIIRLNHRTQMLIWTTSDDLDYIEKLSLAQFQIDFVLS